MVLLYQYQFCLHNVCSISHLIYNLQITTCLLLTQKKRLIENVLFKLISILLVHVHWLIGKACTYKAFCQRAESVTYFASSFCMYFLISIFFIFHCSLFFYFPGKINIYIIKGFMHFDLLCIYTNVYVFVDLSMNY